MASRQLVHCKNPDPQKQGTNIPAWKFELIRKAILESLTGHPDGVPFKDLSTLVRSRLSRSEIDALGSISWHTTVVKLHLEAVTEIERVDGSRPQLLRVADSRA